MSNIRGRPGRGAPRRTYLEGFFLDMVTGVDFSDILDMVCGADILNLGEPIHQLEIVWVSASI